MSRDHAERQLRALLPAGGPSPIDGPAWLRWAADHLEALGHHDLAKRYHARADRHDGRQAAEVARREPAARIGRQVRHARAHLSLTQAEVAHVADVATRTVSAIEQGHPGVQLAVLLRVLHAVGLDLAVSDGPRHRRRTFVDRLGGADPQPNHEEAHEIRHGSRLPLER